MDTDGFPNFFSIGGLLETVNGRSWVALKKCTVKESRNNEHATNEEVLRVQRVTQIPNLSKDPFVHVATPSFYSPTDTNQIHFMELTSFVRKVGVIKVYDKSKESLRYSADTPVDNRSAVLQGGEFLLLTRPFGYPPRRS